jgi:hypothetical protein
MTPKMIAPDLATSIPSSAQPSAATAFLGGSGAAVAGASGDQTPSTEGFLQVLDALLSVSPMMQSAGGTSVSNLFVQTSVTATTSAPVADDASEPDDSAADPSLDPKLCSDIASLLQMLGFQVRPEQIAELSPLDRQQLDSAMEFVGRNLQRGVPASDVSECAALLLPRPWPLDDSDGSPRTPATAVSSQEPVKLPDGFAPALEEARTQLHEAVAAQVGQERVAKPVSRPQAGSATADPPQLALQRIPTSPEAAETLGPVAVVAAAKVAPGRDRQNPQADPQLIQAGPPPQAQPQDSLSVGAELRTRHLPPGGAASELIGRQVLEKVQVQLSEGKRELSLRLWPEELGEVHLSLRMAESDRVSAHIVVENEAVRQAMLDSMPQLRDALVRHGLDLEKVSVSVGHGSTDSAGSGTGADGDGADDRHGRGGNRRRGFDEQEMAVAMPLVLGRDTGRRNGRNTIDLWS